MAGYVYLIGSTTFKWYKIGKSANATIRTRDLGVLLPFRIEVIAVWKSSAYHSMERMLHEKYADNRINGEWFTFEKDEIQAIVADMQWASTDAAVGFSNMQRDFGPQGTYIKVKFKPHNADPMTREERKEFIQKLLVEKSLIPWCTTCRRRIPSNLIKNACVPLCP